jgi:2-dehydro-3-deoxyphosphogluconate aldolase/(4S)-4-hydroxy-2-oxoglutarate aldolase
MSAFDVLRSHRLVSVVEVTDADTAPDLAAALIAGELPILEITLRTEAALPALRKVSAKHPNMTLAAGTVVNELQVKQAVDAGAQ